MGDGGKQEEPSEASTDESSSLEEQPSEASTDEELVWDDDWVTLPFEDEASTSSSWTLWTGTSFELMPLLISAARTRRDVVGTDRRRLEGGATTLRRPEVLEAEFRLKRAVAAAASRRRTVLRPLAVLEAEFLLTRALLKSSRGDEVVYSS